MNLVSGIFALSLLSSNALPLAAVSDTTTTSEAATIETTNVAYDLNLFTNNGVYDYAFDWTVDNKVQFDSYGQASNSEYDNFKFLVIKPVLGDVYVYFYWDATTPYIPTLGTCDIDLSMSTEKADDGSYIEDINTYTATLVNTYGSHDVWMKYKISDVYEVVEDTSYRIYIDSLQFDYVYHGCVGQSEKYVVGNSIIFQTNEDEDLVYDYWRKDYVSIDSGKVAAYLVAKDLVAKSGNTSVGSSYNEYSYYFFNTDEDHSITDLVSVTYNYYLLTYDVGFTFDSVNLYRSDLDSTANSDICYSFCYDGLFDESAENIFQPFNDSLVANKEVSFDVVSDEFYSNQITYSDTTTVEVDRPLIDWWPWWGEQKVSYTFDSIQDLSDIASISDEDEYSAYKSFINNNYLDDEGNAFDFAFKIDTGDIYRSYLNYCINEYYNVFQYNYWAGYDSNITINSECHEIEQTLITHLTYYNDNEFYSLDVLDTPKDTVSIEVAVVPYPDLIDKLFSSVSSWYDLFLAALANFQTAIAIVLAVLISIIVIWIVAKIVSFFKLLTVFNFKKKRK
jgi:hypothetical protein